MNPEETQFTTTDTEDQPAPPRASEPARVAEHIAAPRRDRGGGGAGLIGSHPWMTLAAAGALIAVVGRMLRRG